MKLPAHEVRQYTEQCTDLPPGGTRRFNHAGCATTAGSTSLAVTRTDTGLVVFCHKCNGLVRGNAAYCMAESLRLQKYVILSMTLKDGVCSITVKLQGGGE